MLSIEINIFPGVYFSEKQIERRGYRDLSRLTDEIVYYNDQLDLYLWGITHFGTSWDYVLTDVRIIEETEMEE